MVDARVDDRGVTAASGAHRTASWSLGRLAGIEIRMHPTFLILVVLALLGLFGPPADGLVWIGIVFGGVVLHELGHAVVARRSGLVVRDVVLLPIGGASEIDGLPDDPGRELAVALAGPVTSVVVAIALAGTAVATGGHLGAPSLSTGPLLTRAMWVNLLLASFNLLPALPMDGGRVARALWADRLGFERATIRAARLSRQLAAAMAVVGLVFFVPSLLLIAAFVYVAGRAEEAAMLVHARLVGLVVGDAMIATHDPALERGFVTVHDTDPLEDAAAALAGTTDGIATVLDEHDRVVGVLLARSIAERLSPPA